MFVVVCIFHPSDCKTCKIGGLGPGWPGQKVRLYPQINQIQKAWKHGSSGRATVYQEQSSEFEPQYQTHTHTHTHTHTSQGSYYYHLCSNHRREKTMLYSTIKADAS
jgi:hypothetical protein